MFKRYQHFWKDESGAITADWVVLTAGIVGLGALVFFYMSEPIQNLDSQTGAALSNAQVGSLVIR